MASIQRFGLANVRPNWLTAGMLRLFALSVFIVAIGMIRERLSPHEAWIVIAVAGCAAVAAGLWSLLATRRLLARLPFLEERSQRVSEAVLLLLRRLGLPMLGLVFFLCWTFVYLTLWAIHPHEAFRGLDPHPRFADFFYYAVSTAFTSPPEGIGAGTRGVKSATMIELLTAIALLSAYVSSFVDWRGTPHDRQDQSEAG
jgi:hypothetical protein